ncbi:hypothetical protein QJQ45_018791, partial [Haematococcus lacustris]
ACGLAAGAPASKAMAPARSGEVVKRKRKDVSGELGGVRWSGNATDLNSKPGNEPRSSLPPSNYDYAGANHQQGGSSLKTPQLDLSQQSAALQLTSPSNHTSGTCTTWLPEPLTGESPSSMHATPCHGNLGEILTPYSQQFSLQPSFCGGALSTFDYATAMGSSNLPTLPDQPPGSQGNNPLTAGIKRGLSYSSLAATDLTPPPGAAAKKRVAFPTPPHTLHPTAHPETQLAAAAAAEPGTTHVGDASSGVGPRTQEWVGSQPGVSPEDLAARLFGTSDPQAATAALLRLLMQSLPVQARQVIPQVTMQLQRGGGPEPGSPPGSTTPSSSPGPPPPPAPSLMKQQGTAQDCLPPFQHSSASPAPSRSLAQHQAGVNQLVGGSFAIECLAAAAEAEQGAFHQHPQGQGQQEQGQRQQQGQQQGQARAHAQQLLHQIQQLGLQASSLLKEPSAGPPCVDLTLLQLLLTQQQQLQQQQQHEHAQRLSSEQQQLAMAAVQAQAQATARQTAQQQLLQLLLRGSTSCAAPPATTQQPQLQQPGPPPQPSKACTAQVSECQGGVGAPPPLQPGSSDALALVSMVQQAAGSGSSSSSSAPAAAAAVAASPRQEAVAVADTASQQALAPLSPSPPPAPSQQPSPRSGVAQEQHPAATTAQQAAAEPAAFLPPVPGPGAAVGAREAAEAGGPFSLNPAAGGGRPSASSCVGEQAGASHCPQASADLAQGPRPLSQTISLACPSSPSRPQPAFSNVPGALALAGTAGVEAAGSAQATLGGVTVPDRADRAEQGPEAAAGPSLGSGLAMSAECPAGPGLVGCGGAAGGAGADPGKAGRGEAAGSGSSVCRSGSCDAAGDHTISIVPAPAPPGSLADNAGALASRTCSQACPAAGAQCWTAGGGAAAAAAPAASAAGAGAAAALATAMANGSIDIAALLAGVEAGSGAGAGVGAPRLSLPSTAALPTSPAAVAAAVAQAMGLSLPFPTSSPYHISPPPLKPPSSTPPLTFPPPSAPHPAPAATTSSDSAPVKAGSSHATAVAQLDLSLLPALHLDLSRTTAQPHPSPPLFTSMHCQKNPCKLEAGLDTPLPGSAAEGSGTPAGTLAAGWSFGGGSGSGGGGGGGSTGNATTRSSKRSSRTRSNMAPDPSRTPGLLLSPTPGSARGLGSPDFMATLGLNLDPGSSRQSPGWYLGRAAPLAFDAKSPWGLEGFGSPGTPDLSLGLGLGDNLPSAQRLGAQWQGCLGSRQAGRGRLGAITDFNLLSPLLEPVADQAAAGTQGQGLGQGLGLGLGLSGSAWGLPDLLATGQTLDSPGHHLPSTSCVQHGPSASQVGSPHIPNLHLQPSTTSHLASNLLSLLNHPNHQARAAAPSSLALGEPDQASTGAPPTHHTAHSPLSSLAMRHAGSTTFLPAAMVGVELGCLGPSLAWPPPQRLMQQPGASSVHCQVADSPPRHKKRASSSQLPGLWACSQGGSVCGPQASEGSSSGAAQPGSSGQLGGAGAGQAGSGMQLSDSREGGGLLPPKPRKPRDPATISKVQQCAVSIMRMVGTRTIYERQIRETLGNNPDTSKALRLLMTQGKLARVGAGGRGDPFAYRATPSGLDALQELIINNSLAV